MGLFCPWLAIVLQEGGGGGDTAATCPSLHINNLKIVIQHQLSAWDGPLIPEK